MEEQQQLSYLSFKLGDEEFAANVSQVLEILELPTITKVPHSPSYMRGVMNLRGKVLPVLDTRMKFMIPITEDTINTSIVVLKLKIDGTDQEVGAIVDSVEEVRDIRDEDIDLPPAVGLRYNSSFIKGLVKDKDKFIMVLEINNVFSHE
jgi:purine-binding chemotaxis protein CheW